MRINQNISALNTHSRLTAANNSKSNSLAKLSSGLRINKAGDDAAGLAISEKMRGQVGGLKQSIRNAQDGISLIQTAEGALTETHSILNRMRDLAVQSANDTNTDADRVEIQKEIEELTKEITRISSDTEFNTMKLLNGDFSEKELTFHIGANQDQNFKIGIADMGGRSLKIEGSQELKAADVTKIEDADVSFVEKGTMYAADAGMTETILKDATAAGFNHNLGDTAIAKGQDLKLTQKDIDALVSDANAEIEKLEKDSVANTGNKATNDANIVKIKALKDELVKTKELKTSGYYKADLSANAEYASKEKVSLKDLDKAKKEDIEISTGSALDLTTQEGANAAVSVIDSAVAKVSGERAKLGSAQNRLEHTINNLTATRENLSAAEARIRDVDMAEEMMEFTRTNILSQAATAMLAQANQMPQSVLQLLQ